MTDERKFGVVKHWNGNSAYGFLIEDNGPQHFFHIRDVVTPGVADVPVGQRVEFALGTNKRTGRAQAVNVELINPILDDKRAIAEMAFMQGNRE